MGRSIYDLCTATVVERAGIVAVLPERSDNVVTMAINQWAAEAYLVVQAHLVAARALKIVVDKAKR